MRTLPVILFVTLATTTFGQSVTVGVSLPATDSLKEARINQIRSGLLGKIDSLKSIPNTNKVLLKTLDSLNSTLDSLQAGLHNKLSGGLDKVNTIEERFDKKIDAVEKTLNDKALLFSKNGADVKPLNVDMPKVNVPDNINLPKDINVPIIPARSDLTSKLKAPELNVPDLSTKLGDIPSLDKVDALKSKTADVTRMTGKISEVSAIATDPGQIEKDLESKVSSMQDFKDIEASTLPMKDYTELSKQLSSDPHMAKEMALNKAKESTVNYFAGREKELKAGIDQLSAMKKKYKALGTTVDMFRRPSDPMREKPFIERLYPGIDLQVRATDNTWLTFTANFAYRLRIRWTIGVGWNERISMNIKNRKWIGNEHAYGPQTYGEFMIRRNLAIRSEVDYINSIHPSDTGRTWRWNYYVGVRKMFNISKKAIGSVQLLYNLDQPSKQFFHTQRLTIRTSVQLRLKKPIKN